MGLESWCDDDDGDDDDDDVQPNPYILNPKHYILKCQTPAPETLHPPHGHGEAKKCWSCGTVRFDGTLRFFFGSTERIGIPAGRSEGC